MLRMILAVFTQVNKVRNLFLSHCDSGREAQNIVMSDKGKPNTMMAAMKTEF